MFKKTTATGGAATTTVYLHAGANCIAEYTSGQAPASPKVEFVNAQSIDALVLIDTGSDKLSVVRNQQWSVTALVNVATGSVEERYAYDHFGERKIFAGNGTTQRAVSSHKNPYGYTSRRHEDETGLMYFRARYYDLGTGEFLSRDPLEYVDGMSLYRGYFVPGMVDPYGGRTYNPGNENETINRDGTTTTENTFNDRPTGTTVTRDANGNVIMPPGFGR